MNNILNNLVFLTTTPSPDVDDVLLLGTMLFMFVVMAILFFAVYIFTAIAYSRLFKKAGVSGIRAWIPFLNTIEMSNIAFGRNDVSKYYAGLLIILSCVSGASQSSVLLVITSVMSFTLGFFFLKAFDIPFYHLIIAPFVLGINLIFVSGKNVEYKGPSNILLDTLNRKNN